MGSAILAYPAMQKMRALLPDAKLYFLIFTRNRESVDLLGAIPKENVLVIDDRSFLRFAFSAFLTLLKIRRLRIDATLDLELFSRFTALYSYLTGAPVRIGFHNYTDEGLFRGNFITHPVLYNSTQHIAVNFLNLVHALDAPLDDRPLLKKNVLGDLVPLPQLAVTPEEQRALRAALQQTNPQYSPECRLIVLNPDPGLLALRGWPLEHYCDLARRLLSAHPDLFLVIIGLDRSQDYARRIAVELGESRLINLVGKTSSLREVLVLLSLSHALVTSDSGPGHIAGLTQVHSFVLFGPETPLRYGPLGERCRTFTAGLSCSPCYSAANHRRSDCRNNLCMQQLPVDEVFSAMQTCLS